MVDHKSVLLFSIAVPVAFLLAATSHNGQGASQNCLLKICVI